MSVWDDGRALTFFHFRSRENSDAGSSQVNFYLRFAPFLIIIQEDQNEKKRMKTE